MELEKCGLGAGCVFNRLFVQQTHSRRATPPRTGRACAALAGAFSLSLCVPPKNKKKTFRNPTRAARRPRLISLHLDSQRPRRPPAYLSLFRTSKQRRRQWSSSSSSSLSHSLSSSLLRLDPARLGLFNPDQHFVRQLEAAFQQVDRRGLPRRDDAVGADAKGARPRGTRVV